MSGKQVQNSGVNNQGNDYTAYTDGGYAYKNSNSGNLTFLTCLNIEICYPMPLLYLFIIVKQEMVYLF